MQDTPPLTGLGIINQPCFNILYDSILSLTEHVEKLHKSFYPRKINQKPQPPSFTVLPQPMPDSIQNTLLIAILIKYLPSPECGYHRSFSFLRQAVLHSIPTGDSWGRERYLRTPEEHTNESR